MGMNGNFFDRKPKSVDLRSYGPAPDWFASGPVTTAVLVNSLGVGRLFGLVFISQQVGPALAAIAGGRAYMQFVNII